MNKPTKAELTLTIANVILKGDDAKLAEILMNEHGYTKTQIAKQGLKLLGEKEGVVIKDGEQS